MTQTPWGAPLEVGIALHVWTTPPDSPARREVYAYRGHWWQREGEAMCRYREADAASADAAATMTTLRFSRDQVTLLRQGEIACRQVFRVGQTGRGLYRTPYGAFPMVWRCHGLEAEVLAGPEAYASGIPGVDDVQDAQARLAWLRFSYDLELGGQYLGRYEVHLDVRRSHFAEEGGMRDADRGAAGRMAFGEADGEHGPGD